MSEPAIRMTQFNDVQIPHDRPLFILGVNSPVTVYGTVTNPGITVVCSVSGPFPSTAAVITRTTVANGTSWSVPFGTLANGTYSATANTQPPIEPGDSLRFHVPVS
jgi:hypothetical protein